MAVSADTRLGQERSIGNGTAAAASELFRLHSPMVLAVCRRLLADPAEAEDAMQQTFLHAYRALLAGREPRRPAAWLASIARNECLNRIRARMREPVADPLADGDAGSTDVLDAAIAGEDLRALGHTIKKLPSQQREALLLHEFCGLRYEEVAAAIGVSESAIGSLLFRARSRLRFLLQRAYGLLPAPGLWDLARGPGAKVAALPLVAKVGTAAVAVSLATGSAVVVERELEAPKKPAPPPARTSAAVAAPTGVLGSAPKSEPVADTRAARSSPTSVVPAITPRHIGEVSPAKSAHRAHPGRADHPIHPGRVATAGKDKGRLESTSSPAAPAPPGRAPGRTGSSSSSPVRGRSTHSPPRGAAPVRSGSPALKAARARPLGKRTSAKTPAQAPPIGTRRNKRDNAKTGGSANGNSEGRPSRSQPADASVTVAAGAAQSAGGSADHAGDGARNRKDR